MSVTIDQLLRAVKAAPNSARAHFDLGLFLHRQGQLDQAIASYEKATALDAKFFDAHNNLGVIWNMKGRLDRAMACYQRALAINAGAVITHFNLATALRDAGNMDAAIAGYQRAVALDPNLFAAHFNLGAAFKNTGRLDAAIAAYRTAIAIKPDFVEAHVNLANTLIAKEDFDSAIVSCRQALAMQPKFVEAHIGLGIALGKKKETDQAIASLQTALVLNPDSAAAMNNLGLVLEEKGDIAEALRYFHRALAAQPNSADAYSNLGRVLLAAGKLDEAIDHLRKALAIKPDLVASLNRLGNALKEKGQLDEALACYQYAVARAPSVAGYHYNLGNVLVDLGRLDEAMAAYQHALSLDPTLVSALNNLGNCLKDTGDLDEALACYRKALELDPTCLGAADCIVYSLTFHPNIDPPKLLPESRAWNDRFARPLAKLIQPHTNDRDPNRRLRIGYVSPDFRHHPVGRFMVPLLAAHHKDAVEVYCYAHILKPDHITEESKKHADMWRSMTGLSDEELAQTIRRDRIDILVDLTMHMTDNRLLVFARKPAPVQVTYLAVVSGAGVETIDYRLTDAYLDPDEADDKYYIEKPIRLAASYWCYRPSIETGPVNELPAMKNRAITFGCLNNFAKVSPAAMETWSDLLSKLPDARLLLHCRAGRHRDRVLQFFGRRGIGPARIDMVGLQGRYEYFDTYRRIDIALDPFPYPGGTTTCDALWMGVPTVTLNGRWALWRAGVNILSYMDLQELIADTTADYQRIAFELAHHWPRLAHLRATLRQRMQNSPLMDADGCARALEAAYGEMWRRWCAT